MDDLEQRIRAEIDIYEAHHDRNREREFGDFSRNPAVHEAMRNLKVLYMGNKTEFASVLKAVAHPTTAAHVLSEISIEGDLSEED